MSAYTIRPMLACKTPEDIRTLKFPLYASYKLNGIRCLAVDGVAQSRSGKPLPNRHIQKFFAANAEYLNGLDGELIVGRPNAEDVWNATTSGVMTIEGEPHFTYHVFDVWNSRTLYAERIRAARIYLHELRIPQVHFHSSSLLEHPDELELMETTALSLGYEGLITRFPHARYKNGRSTLSEQGMVKIKRFADSEAEILSMSELQHNENFQDSSELGYAKRSSSMDGLVGADTMGVLHVRDIHHGWEFGIGTGFTAAERKEFWEWKNESVGQVVKYKYFEIGMQKVPLLPVYLGKRSELDLS